MLRWSSSLPPPCACALSSVLACAPPSVNQTAGEASTPAPVATRPNLVLVTVDTLRADRTSLLGHKAPTTPVLKSLSAQSTVFAQAIAPAPWTLPSVASTWTGLWPREHGVTDRSRALPDGAETLAESLQTEGYETAFFGVNAAFVTGHGLDQGFETWQPSTGTAAAQLNRDIAAFLDARTDPRPLFIAVHYFEPHCPYTPPQSTRDRFAVGNGPPDPLPPGALEALGDCYVVRDDSGTPSSDRRLYLARYDGEVAAVDRALGDLWRLVSPLEPTLAVLADHGEAFWERGVHGHGTHLTQEQVHVPMLWSQPGATPAQITTPVSTLWATHALRALGQGRAAPPPTGLVVSETRYGGRDSLAIFGDDAAQHWDRASGETWRHDLRTDPGERTRLAPDPALRAVLEVYAARQPAVAPADQDLSPGEAEALKTLGYRVGGP